MRLRDLEIESIRTSFRQLFGKHDNLWLFGSRANDAQFGGDSDLYLTSATSHVIQLWKFIGDQKIDIVVNQLSANLDIPIYQLAKKTGIKLV
jgi:hypothetical protein